MQAQGPLGLRFDVHLDGDLAALGEFDGVAHQVDEDFLQPQGVAHQGRAGQAGVDLQPQRQALGGGLFAHDALEGVDHLAEVEGLVFEGEALGLDLGEVEDVVEQVEQLFGGHVDLDQLGQQVRVVDLFEQQVGEAEDGVHRRAQLVAHVGQEGAFGAVGRFGGFLGEGELEGAAFDQLFEPVPVQPELFEAPGQFGALLFDQLGEVVLDVGEAVDGLAQGAGQDADLVHRGVGFQREGAALSHGLAGVHEAIQPVRERSGQLPRHAPGQQAERQADAEIQDAAQQQRPDP